MKVSVLFNAAAGTDALARQRERMRQVRQVFATTGIEADVQAVEGADLTLAAADAASGDVDAVVAAGGDGTINAVAAALIDEDKPLGILPAGTLNHFAQDLNIPLDLPAAVGMIATGTVQRVDVGEVNGRIFLNNSSIGLYPAMVLERDVVRRRSGGAKWSAMMTATLRVLRRLPLLRVRVTIGSEELERTTPFVFVGNNPYQFDLFALGQRESLTSGQLSIYTAHCRNRWDMARLAWRAARGQLEQAGDFDMLQAAQLTVETTRPRIAVALDGEVVRLQTPLKYRSRPRALAVIAPSPWQAPPAQLTPPA